MNKKQSLAFENFKSDVLKLDYVDIDTLYLFINRHTCNFKSPYGFNARLRYHRFFIKMLEGQGIIVPTERFQFWRVERDSSLLSNQ